MSKENNEPEKVEPGTIVTAPDPAETLLYECDCGARIKDREDEAKHLAEVHDPTWAPSKGTEEAKDEAKKNLEAKEKAEAEAKEKEKESQSDTQVKSESPEPTPEPEPQKTKSKSKK